MGAVRVPDGAQPPLHATARHAQQWTGGGGTQMTHKTHVARLKPALCTMLNLVGLDAPVVITCPISRAACL